MYLLKKSNTFNDFNKLILQGQLKLLTIAEYVKKNTTINNSRVIIKQFYKSLNI